MTFAPEKIGDEGQPFVVQAWGYPNENINDWQNCAYCKTYESAERLEEAFKLCPGAADVRIFNRELGKEI